MKKTEKKPDLQTVLIRRQRNIEDFFREGKERGLTKEQIMAVAELDYSLSTSSIGILNEVFKTKKVKQEADVAKTEVKQENDKHDNQQEESKIEPKEQEVDNKAEVEETVEPEDKTEETPAASKKKSNKNSNKDSE